jgi:hypothetical protein
VKIGGDCLVKGEYQSHPDTPEPMGRNNPFQYGNPRLRDHEQNSPSKSCFISSRTKTRLHCFVTHPFNPEAWVRFTPTRYPGWRALSLAIKVWRPTAHSPFAKTRTFLQINSQKLSKPPQSPRL